MKFDRNFLIQVFQPTLYAWNTLHAVYNTPWVQVDISQNGIKNWIWMRGIAPLANATKRMAVRVAFVIATISTGVWSPLKYGFHLLQMKTRSAEVIASDLRLIDSLRPPTPLSSINSRIPGRMLRDQIDSFQRRGPRYDLQREIERYITENSAPTVPSNRRLSIPREKRNEYVLKAMAYYARSQYYYGPLAVDWVHNLLTQANERNQKLVFMARDGIAPYHLARTMMKMDKFRDRFPNLVGDDRIVLGYFSRKLVTHHHSGDEQQFQIFRKYIAQLGIKPGDKCRFVDIGFQGSMIKDIRKMLSENEIDFNFFISLTSQAEGYVSPRDDTRRELSSCTSSEANPGVWWLETAHQGTDRGPSHLVEHTDEFIYPNTLVPGQESTYISDPVIQGDSLEYLLRHWGLKAIKDSLSVPEFDPDRITPDRREVYIKRLDGLLHKIQADPSIMWTSNA